MSTIKPAIATRVASSRSSQRLPVAIPVTIAGKNVAGRRFNETTRTLEVNRTGGRLTTQQELEEGAILDVTANTGLGGTRTCTARVVWVGKPEEQNIREIGIELGDAEDFWGIQFPKAATDKAEETALRRARVSAAPPGEAAPPARPAPAPVRIEPQSAELDPPVAASRPAGRAAPASSPVPPAAAPAARAGSSPSQPALAGVDLTDTLNGLLANSLQSNVRSALAGLDHDIHERIEQIKQQALESAEQRLKAATVESTDKLEMRALDIVTRNERALDQVIQDLLKGAEERIARRIEETAQRALGEAQETILKMVAGNRERLKQEAADAVSAASITLRHDMQQEIPQLENQFADQCRLRANRIVTARLEEIETGLNDRALGIEEDMMRRLHRRTEDWATEFDADLGESSQRLLDQARGGVQNLVDEAADLARERFIHQAENELSRKRQQAIDDAVQAARAATENSIERARTSFARLMKDLGQAMLQQAELLDQAEQQATPPRKTPPTR